jgi:hypothetical protein
MSGRVERRKADLDAAAMAYYLRKIPLDELCVAALKYASAVHHNRKARDRQKEQKTWEKKPES